MQKVLRIVIALTIAVAIFYSGFLAGQSIRQTPLFPDIDTLNSSSNRLNMSLFWESYDRLQRRFFDRDKLDPQKLLYGAISGLIKAAEDPYTVFLNPSESKLFFEDVSGEFEGVGMEIGIRKGQLTVIAPLAGAPAERVGIRAGDRVIKIDDKVTVDMTVEEAVSLIRGPKGTSVKLTILRNNGDESKEFVIRRERIVIPSLSWELKDGQIAYLRLFHFTQKADSDFRVAAQEIINSGAKVIALDLRNNPGGFLDVAQNIGGWFLDRGEVVAVEDFGDGNKREYKSPGPSKLKNFKVVVLVNEGSASASEILAAALRDHLEVKLVGQKTFGKGSVQELERLSDNSSLKVTVAKWLSPKGNLIDGVGLEPDVLVEIPDEQLETGGDRQLDKALEILLRN